MKLAALLRALAGGLALMAAPPLKTDAPEALRRFHYCTPQAGEILIWESWLRHEVPMNMVEDERISVSFNYKWVDG